jgi:uncharacterized membrane protein YkvA (DUF1232 family)
MLARLKIWASTIRRDVLALYLVGRDPRVPWYVKALAVATAAYALSPIDLIPDFIPVLGYLDDLVILPLAILLVVRLVAPEVMADLRMQAERRLMTDRPRSTAGAVFIVLLWLTSAAAAFVVSR